MVPSRRAKLLRSFDGFGSRLRVSGASLPLTSPRVPTIGTVVKTVDSVMGRRMRLTVGLRALSNASRNRESIGRSSGSTKVAARWSGGSSKYRTERSATRWLASITGSPVDPRCAASALSAATASIPSLSRNANGWVSVRLKTRTSSPSSASSGTTMDAMPRPCKEPCCLGRELVVRDEDRRRRRCERRGERTASTVELLPELGRRGRWRSTRSDGGARRASRLSSRPATAGLRSFDRRLRRARPLSLASPRSSTARRGVPTAPPTSSPPLALVSSSRATVPSGCSAGGPARWQHDGDAERSVLAARREADHVREQLLDRRPTVEQCDRHGEHALADAHRRTLRVRRRRALRVAGRDRDTTTVPEASGVAGTMVGLPTGGCRFRPCSDAWKSVRVGTRPCTSTRIVAPLGAPVTRRRMTRSASGSTTGVWLISPRMSVLVVCAPACRCRGRERRHPATRR